MRTSLCLFLILAISLLASRPETGAMILDTYSVKAPDSQVLIRRLTHSPLLYVRQGDIWEVRDGVFHNLIKNGADPAWSTHKRKIAFVRAGNLWICDASGKYQRQVTPFRPTKAEIKDFGNGFPGISLASVSSPTWDPSGRELAFARVDRYIVTRDLPYDESAFANDIGARTPLAISDIFLCLPYRSKPEKGTAGHGSAFVWISSCTSGLPSYSVSHCAAPSFAHSGHKLAFARNGDLWMASITPFSLTPRPKGTEKHLENGWDWPQEYWDWDETRIEASAVYVGSIGRSNGTCFVDHISWSPDGKMLVYSLTGLSESGHNAIYLVRTGKTPIQRWFVSGSHPAFSPDGAFVAYNSDYTEAQRAWLGIECLSLDHKVHFVITREGHDPSW